MPDNSMNFIRQGSGSPSIVFVHGLLCRHSDWWAQVAHFPKSRSVLACDLRGHGASPRGEAPMSIETLGRDVATLLQDQKLVDVVLVGHSMGCRVVMEASRQAKDRIAGLIMVDGSRFAEDPETATQAIDAVIAEIGYSRVMEAMFNGMFFGEPPSWKPEKMAQVLAIPEDTGLPLLRSMIAWDASQLDPVLSSIDVPLHVIQSTTLGPDRTRQALKPGDISSYQSLLKNRVKGATCESITAGHFCMMEAPEAVNKSIDRFLDENLRR